MYSCLVLAHLRRWMHVYCCKFSCEFHDADRRADIRFRLQLLSSFLPTRPRAVFTPALAASLLPNGFLPSAGM